MSSLYTRSITDPRTGKPISVILPKEAKPQKPKKAFNFHFISLIGLVLTNAFFTVQILTQI